MNSIEIITIVVTTIGVVCFALVFTLLFSSYASSNIEAINSGKKDKELIEEAIQLKKESTQNKKKAFGAVKSVVFYVLLVFLIPVFIFSIVNKSQGNATMIGDSTVMVVASGSMSEKNPVNDYLNSNDSRLNNQFDTYDIIVLNKVNNQNELKIYDVIAFRNDQGINVIHRIIGTEYRNGKPVYVTRGDANGSNDVYRPSFEDVIGKYNGKKISSIGIFVIFFQSAPGIITILATVYCFIMLDRISGKVSKTQEERLKKIVSIIGELDESSLEDLKVTYKQIIHHKGNEYCFDENGLLENNNVSEDETNNVEKEDSTNEETI